MRIHLLLSFFALSLVSCQHLRPSSTSKTKNTPKKEEKKKEHKVREILIGTVSTHEKKTGIVLLRLFNKTKIRETDVCLIKGMNTAGNVKLTGQENRFFLAAQYQSGVVEVGDSVFLRRVQFAPEEEKKTVNQENPTPAPPEEKPAVTVEGGFVAPEEKKESLIKEEVVPFIPQLPEEEKPADTFNPDEEVGEELVLPF